MTKQYDQMEMNKNLIKRSKAKITPEERQRQIILKLARAQGCEMDVINIFTRYDNLLKGTSNAEEKQHLAIMAITELHKLLNVQGSLQINGFEILPAKGELIK